VSKDKKQQYDRNGFPILGSMKRSDPLPEAIVDYLNTKYADEDKALEYQRRKALINKAPNTRR